MQMTYQEEREHDELYGVGTVQDAIGEFAANIGGEEGNADRQWLLSDYDVWVRNPHYHGPAQRHPEDDSDEDDTPPAVRGANVQDDGEDDIPF